MGPPFPPQPVEIDLNSSRTLPSPSGSATAAGWEPLFQPHMVTDYSYGSSNVAKMHPVPINGPARGSGQDPLVQWYTGNDGPWIPKVIPDIVPEEGSSQSRQTTNRNIMPYGGQYRQMNPSDAGSAQFGFPHSDSGYGTRRSIENTSVFSADVTEQDIDCPNLGGHVAEFQPFYGLKTTSQNEGRPSDCWTYQSQGSYLSPGLVCPTCHKPVKTQSELKYDT